MTLYHKLVRDKIPARILAKGEHCTFRSLSENEINEALAAKGCEEALELKDAIDLPGNDSLRREKIVRETADLLEVLRAILKREGITLREVYANMHAIRTERGGFDEFIFLEEADPIR